MNKTLNNDNSKPTRRIDTAGCRSSLTDGSTINKEEAKRNRKERQDGLSRRVLSTLCPCWTALATVRPEHATELGHYTQGSRLSEKYYITGDPQPRTMDWPDWPQRVARILPGIDSSARSATAAAFLFNTRRATTKSVTRILSSVMACSTEVGLLECVYLAQSH